MYHNDTLQGGEMTKQEIIRQIRQAAASGKILYTQHAIERMQQREISRLMVVQCLLAGTSTRPAFHNTAHQTYECRISHYAAGTNYDVVAAISPQRPDAIIVTVINTDDRD
ncbi:TPA: DUF4258 domain-containing protein [Neisseria meningitidis]|uniref:DUF4258 domain-containing protein n=2 Tax=Neisseria polysaccharea TaxID=489 RepID=UPI0027E1F38B|nr:DUF4258 domain-containing protein [Neisseria polysaccharea]